MSKKKTKKNNKEEVVEQEQIVIKKIPGQVDFNAKDYKEVDYVLNKIKKLAESFGFQRVESSFFEHGQHAEESLEHEPLKFKVSNQEAILKTSGQSGVLRMYAEMHATKEEDEEIENQKWFYLTPVVRFQDNPQQIITTIEYGFEILGEPSAIADAQVLALGWKIYSELGDDSIVLEVGSRGCEKCWPEYTETLTRSFSDAKYSLCKDCAHNVEDNPEKILYCENEDCQSIAASAPTFLDYLDDDCQAHFKIVLESLEEMGVPYVISPVVESDDHIKRTYFRFIYNHPQDSFILSKGHRHNKLMSQYNLNHHSLGMRGDISKLLRAWHLSGQNLESKKVADVALIPLGDFAAQKALPVFSLLWDEGIEVRNFMSESSLKERLKTVTESKIPLALIVGHKEALDDTIIVRDVKSGMQEVFPTERLLKEVEKRL